MFTGLIEETGEIANIKMASEALYLTVNANKVLDNLKIGDSIAVNGACQTVIEINNSSFTVFASRETLNVTNFLSYKAGTIVNLERTLRIGDRLDGHIVSGHIDTTAVVKNIKSIGDAYEFSFEIDSKYKNQIVKKGSITINGISLTVANTDNNTFSIAIIPITFEATNLKFLKIGDTVNIETDILGKYIEKYLSSNHNNSNINIELLERNGFI